MTVKLVLICGKWCFIVINEPTNERMYMWLERNDLQYSRNRFRNIPFHPSIKSFKKVFLKEFDEFRPLIEEHLKKREGFVYDTI